MYNRRSASLLPVVWVVIGVLVAYAHHYFSNLGTTRRRALGAAGGPAVASDPSGGQHHDLHLTRSHPRRPPSATRGSPHRLGDAGRARLLVLRSAMACFLQARRAHACLKTRSWRLVHRTATVQIRGVLVATRSEN